MFLNIFRPHKEELTSILKEEIIKGDEGKFKNLIIDKNSITITEHYDVTTMETTSQDNSIMNISTTPGTKDPTSATTTILTTTSITTTATQPDSSICRMNFLNFSFHKKIVKNSTTLNIHYVIMFQNLIGLVMGIVMMKLTMNCVNMMGAIAV